MAKKITRKSLLEAAEEMELKVTVKGKPISNEALLKLVQKNMEEFSDEDGRYENETLADIAAAMDTKKEIVVTGDDPTNKKMPAKPEKPKGKGKSKSDDDDDDDDEKPKGKGKAKGKDKKKSSKKDDGEKKEKANTDRWGSREGSSAYAINRVLDGTSKKNAMTIAEIHAAVAEERDDVSRERVTAHLRRLHLVSELIERDDKERYFVPKVAKS